MKKSRCFVLCLRRSGVLGVVVSLVLACGSEPEIESAEAGAAPSGANAASPGSASASPGGSSALSDGAAMQPSTAADALAASEEASSPGEVQVTADVQPVFAGDAGVSADLCSLVPADDVCGSCVCRECGEALLECFSTPGCAEILACAEQTGCQGLDCYCGDSSIADCLDGVSNGPCKEVFLTAPDSREPSTTNPSAGPAADAAGEVADCAEDDSTCEDSCELD